MHFDIIMPSGGVTAVAKPCVESIVRVSAAMAAEGHTLHLLWINNGGTREHVDELNAVLDHYQIGDWQRLDIKDNVGFVKATNHGLRARCGAGDAVILLSDDTIVYPTTFEMLWKALEANPRLGLVGPLSNSGASNWINHAPGEDPKMPHDMRAAYFADRTPYPDPIPVTELAFFCAMIRPEVIDQVGLLDERFGLGFGEDDQYCIRAHLARWDLAIVPRSYCFHAHRKTFFSMYGTAGTQAIQDRSIAELDAWKKEQGL